MHTDPVPRRPDVVAVLAAKVSGRLEAGAPPAELAATAQGRLDVLELALTWALRASAMRAPIAEHAERLRAAMELVGACSYGAVIPSGSHHRPCRGRYGE